jgi:hypothetical protein
MKGILLYSFLVLTSFSSISQQLSGAELGFDCFFSASNIGGAAGIGPKLGFKLNENLVIGPSFRYQRTWTTDFQGNYSYTIWGGGAFVHARYKNVLFGGLEFELLKTPYNYTTTGGLTTWVSTLFLCGGYSKEFNKHFRLTIGLYYDVINSVNSPFRNAYILKTKDATTGAVVKILPLIYRISFVFPIWTAKEKNSEEEE